MLFFALPNPENSFDFFSLKNKIHFHENTN